MYLSHFDLREPPFAMTPDPRFLYMSGRHREALAHLLYGVTAHGGFVQLTGEVGTGKTSVCRCLLEQLPPHVDAALVLNPQLSPVELLAAFCDELRIPRPPEPRSPKVLVDLLYRHLLDAHATGRRTLLIVDEAQALAPDVLEQVRLLTNLETAREKLLQVILIGQPELAELLAQPGLRQLAQRITARYHLEPLSRGETASYIAHRLAVAGCRSPLFTKGALRVVHARAGGVPRLINAISDRALLGAYAAGRPQVDRAIARRAARELFGTRRGPARRWGTAAAGGLGAAAAGLLLVVLAPSETARQPREDAAPPPVAGAPPSSLVPLSPPGVAAADGSVVPGPRLAELLADRTVPAGREEALEAVLARWAVVAGPRPECASLASTGLECAVMVGSWRKLKRIDLPAVLELTGPDGRHRYAAVTALSGSRLALGIGSRSLTTSIVEVEPHWDGAFLVVWPPPGVPLPVRPGARGPGVDWVRAQLARAGAGPVTAEPGRPFDDALRAQVVAFQRARSLEPDGIVGRETAIVLVARGRANAPRLSEGTP